MIMQNESTAKVHVFAVIYAILTAVAVATIAVIVVGPHLIDMIVNEFWALRAVATNLFQLAAHLCEMLRDTAVHILTS